MSKVRRADWNIWGQRLSVELWQAVALAFDAEPETVPGLVLEWRASPFAACPKDFLAWLTIACDHAENGALRVEGSDPTPFRKVRLAEFADWARAAPRNWQLPQEFPRSHPPAEISGSVGTGETNSLKDQDCTSTPILKALQRPATISDTAWRRYLDALEVPGFPGQRGSISKAARRIAQSKADATSVRRDLTRILALLRKNY
jgi:hypothetical protein